MINCLFKTFTMPLLIIGPFLKERGWCAVGWPLFGIIAFPGQKDLDGHLVVHHPGLTDGSVVVCMSWLIALCSFYFIILLKDQWTAIQNTFQLNYVLSLISSWYKINLLFFCDRLWCVELIKGIWHSSWWCFSAAKHQISFQQPHLFACTCLAAA